MDSHDNSLCQKNSSITLRQILLIQAYIRGFIVRNRMKKLRAEFEEIMEEIDPNENFHVVWKRDFLCLPEISSKKASCCKAFQLNSKSHKIKPPKLLTKPENHMIAENFNQISSKVSSNFAKEFSTSNSLNQCSNSQTSTSNTKCCNTQGIHYRREKELHKNEEMVETDENHFREDSIESEQPKKERKTSTFTPLDCSTLTDVTSVWDSDSANDSLDDNNSSETINSLLQDRQSLVMELVWIQQAISSRKNYLQLKSQIET